MTDQIYDSQQFPLPEKRKRGRPRKNPVGAPPVVPEIPPDTPLVQNDDGTYRPATDAERDASVVVGVTFSSPTLEPEPVGVAGCPMPESSSPEPEPEQPVAESSGYVAILEPPAERFCGACRYWTEESTPVNQCDVGPCRRNPPSVISLSGRGLLDPVSYTFPLRHRTSAACGEWTP
jgi:hypothetical protein